MNYYRKDCNQFHAGIGKVLVHHLVWRHRTGALVDPLSHISHIDADKRYVECVQESREMNESRKFCHLFGWYATLTGEETPRCPHRERPCTGPLDARHAVIVEDGDE